MRCNRHYMNDALPPLNSNEKRVVDLFYAQNHGKTWLARPFLETQLCRPDRIHPGRFGDMPQRTLDRALRHLEKVGVVTREVAKDRGAVYALSSVVKDNPWLRDMALKGEVLGKDAIILPVGKDRAIKLTITPPPKDE